VDITVAATYRPRDGTTGVLHAVVREHLEEFLVLATQHGDGTGMPPFVEQELRRFLGCGVLAHGFARVRCDGCGFERFVPFSCKGRGFCPSCGGRRMAERARCGGRLRVLATLEEPRIVQKILRHVGLPAEPVAARSPPEASSTWW
jgi:hypothetical protein